MRDHHAPARVTDHHVAETIHRHAARGPVHVDPEPARARDDRARRRRVRLAPARPAPGHRDPSPAATACAPRRSAPGCWSCSSRSDHRSTASARSGCSARTWSSTCCWPTSRRSCCCWGSRARCCARPCGACARSRSGSARSSHPAVALAAYVGLMWLWHVPAMYDLALEHAWAHVLEHASFFTAGIAFWWYLIEPVPPRHRLRGPWALAYLSAAKLLMGALGVVLAFSPERELRRLPERAAHLGSLPARGPQRRRRRDDGRAVDRARDRVRDLLLRGCSSDPSRTSSGASGSRRQSARVPRSQVGTRSEGELREACCSMVVATTGQHG